MGRNTQKQKGTPRAFQRHETFRRLSPALTYIRCALAAPAPRAHPLHGRYARLRPRLARVPHVPDLLPQRPHVRVDDGHDKGATGREAVERDVLDVAIRTRGARRDSQCTGMAALSARASAGRGGARNSRHQRTTQIGYSITKVTRNQVLQVVGSAVGDEGGACQWVSSSSAQIQIQIQIPLYKHICDTGQTGFRNKLLAHWVHLTNHAAGHSSPGATHQSERLSWSAIHDAETGLTY